MIEKLPKVYLSGTHPLTKQASEEDLIKRSGCTHRCYAYAYVAKGAFRYTRKMEANIETDVEMKIGIMMDSSAHSYQKLWLAGTITKKELDQVAELYIDYVKENKKKWDFYVTLDYERNSPLIYQITKKMEKKGIRPAPVFHGDSGFDYLERYVKEGYDFICLGTVKRDWPRQLQYYEKCFDIAAKGKNVKLHGLAVTGYNLLFAFPWYSVDSATWAKNGAYGMIVIPHPITKQLTGIHVSDRHSNTQQSINTIEPSVRRVIINYIEEMGFKYDLIRTSGYERSVLNAKVYSSLHKLRPEGKTMSKWGSLV